MKPMPMDLDKVMADALHLPSVPLQGTHAYKNAESRMVRMVNTHLSSRADIMHLIGNNPLQMMYDNHRHHAAFMATVFSINGYGMLARTVVWVYRAYHSHGFSYEYFPVELKAWKEAVICCLDPQHSKEILIVYDWMLRQHQKMIELSRQPAEPTPPVSENWLEIQTAFRDGLLSGDHRACLQQANSYLEQMGELQAFYLHVVQPVMYEIGRMWENAEISVAQEHLASAVAARILATSGGNRIFAGYRKGKALVTAVQNEYHEMGAWMISDILEQDGWQVRYLGSNTPREDLLRMLDDYLPDLLAVSVTMAFNLDNLNLLLAEIRANPLHTNLHIMIGGRVFLDNPELVSEIKAHSFARNLHEAQLLARSCAETRENEI